MSNNFPWERVRFDAPPTYFVHIPKTGGSSFKQLMDAVYAPREQIRTNQAQLRAVTLNEFQAYRYYHSAHQDRGMFDLLQRPDVACMTMVRDPIERAVSSVLYGQQTLTARHLHKYADGNPLPLLHKLRTAGIDECLDHPFMQYRVINVQTNILGITTDYRMHFKGNAPAVDSASLGWNYETLAWNDPLPLLSDTTDPQKVLANACTWLSEMAFVGLTERYAESMILICDLLGVAPPLAPPRANSNPRQPDATVRYRNGLAPAIVSRLEEFNRNDLELYAFASDLFTQQWARYQTRPRRTYSLAPRLRQTVAQVRRALRPVKRFVTESLSGGNR